MRAFNRLLAAILLVANFTVATFGQEADAERATPEEEIRRFAAARGHSLVAVCQDARVAGHPLGRDGYRSMLGVLGAGGVVVH